MSKGVSAKSGGQGLLQLLTLISLLTPLLVVVAVFGTRLGAWSLAFGFEVLTLQVGSKLAWVGAAAALVALILGLRSFSRSWPWVITAVVSAVACLAVYQVQGARYAAAHAPDVTSSPDEPPAFSRAILAERGGLNGPSVACDGLVTVPRQVAPETASYAMREAGFTPRGTAAFRADGYLESFWFGQIHDVSIRIRPGQTDVRVAARYPVKDGDRSCQLAKAVAAGLQPVES